MQCCSSRIQTLFAGYWAPSICLTPSYSSTKEEFASHFFQRVKINSSWACLYKSMKSHSLRTQPSFGSASWGSTHASYKQRLLVLKQMLPCWNWETRKVTPFAYLKILEYLIVDFIHLFLATIRVLIFLYIWYHFVKPSCIFLSEMAICSC